MTRICFVAVNYNSSSDTLEYVESICRLTVPAGCNVEILIVDNKSREENFKLLSDGVRSLNNVTLIRNPVNAGYFSGLNSGIRTVKEKRDVYFVVGNNDMTFDQHFIEELLKIKYDAQTLVLAPDVVTINGFHQNPMVIHKMGSLRKWGLKFYFTFYYGGQLLYSMVKLLKKTLVKNEKVNTPMFIHMGIGACYVLTGNFFNHFDQLDEDVFLWSEEAMLRGQLNRVNGKMLYCPDLVVHHKESSTVNKMKSKKVWEIASASFRKNYRHY